MTLLVLGSLNMDLVVRSHHLPQPGETLVGSEFTTVAGGKGANQAVAAARLGATTYLVGRVGDDSFGRALGAGLAAAGVQENGLYIDASTATGIAAIAVADTGENHIVIVPGANGRVDHHDVARLQPLLPQAQFLLMQLEIPLAAVLAAARAARAAEVAVILDPAPAPDAFPPELYSLVNILTPNQVEAAQLVGHPVETVAQAQTAAATLRGRGVETVLITLSALGTVCAQGAEMFHCPAFTVRAVDTVAAGDAFNGALAVALAEGQPLSAAVRWASGAAALAVTQPGAQTSLPLRSQLEAFLAAQRSTEP
ncbi:ribokinase [Leptolyngbya sp. PCC 6406]|uniref:ribokinase n=1 Tax=Leptolyngbya sp. PCC 6406 TaxID=1173264 RepID=UPI0002AC5B2C|nr:ribokinase [Leptolyngbya sp. PCC 6406]